MFLSERNGSVPTLLRKKYHDKALVPLDILLLIRRTSKAIFLPLAVYKVRIASIVYKLKTLKPTNLKPIKQVELCTKREPLLTKEVAGITSPKTSDEIIELVKEKIGEKN